MGSAAILASGNGSNFAAIVEHLKERNVRGESTHKVSLLICDQPGAPVIGRAEQLSIPSIVVPYGDDRKAAESRILAALQECEPQLVVLAGFMRILPEAIVAAFAGQIVNIHPSLLPRHAGLHGIKDSFESSDAELGITIHHVDLGVDSGPIIEQRSFEREPGDTLDSIEERIHQLEHTTYPQAVVRLLDEQSRRKGLPV